MMRAPLVLFVGIATIGTSCGGQQLDSSAVDDISDPVTSAAAATTTSDSSTTLETSTTIRTPTTAGTSTTLRSEPSIVPTESTPPTTTEATTEPPPPTTTEPTTEPTQMTTQPPASDLETAIADLAARLDVDVSDIDVVSIEEVTWPDGSIGCPAPGMSYTQALVDGSRIVLAYDGIEYSYHQGGGRAVFFCPPDRVVLPSAPIDADL